MGNSELQVREVPGMAVSTDQISAVRAFNRDYTMVLGCVLFYAALIVVFNLIVDLVLVWMNPRLKFE